jgi:hypothetical protein
MTSPRCKSDVVSAFDTDNTYEKLPVLLEHLDDVYLHTRLFCIHHTNGVGKTLFERGAQRVSMDLCGHGFAGWRGEPYAKYV